MSLEEFKYIFWWEWFHRFFARLIGIVFLFPFLYFYFKKFKFFLLVSSKKNVFRGFHFQKRKQQEKLVVVVKGKIIDYCIDLRKKSKTFGKVFKFCAYGINFR